MGLSLRGFNTDHGDTGQKSFRTISNSLLAANEESNISFKADLRTVENGAFAGRLCLSGSFVCSGDGAMDLRGFMRIWRSIKHTDRL
jgi:hypothetical protein